MLHLAKFADEAGLAVELPVIELLAVGVEPPLAVVLDLQPATSKIDPTAAAADAVAFDARNVDRP